jgi:hypothetical protein
MDKNSSTQNHRGSSKSKRANSEEGAEGAAEMEMTMDSGPEATADEPKSVGSIISQSLARESQESIDRVLSDVSSQFKSARTYTSTNPGEAVLIGVTVALGAWVLLGTKPGRKVFDAGAERFIPEVTKWISQTFAGQTSGRSTH